MISCKIPEDHQPEQTGCGTCTKEWKKQYYQKNKQAYRDRQKPIDRQRRYKGREILREAKNVACIDCGIKYPFYVMQFDHVSGTKEYTVARMITMAPEKILEEISKCEVVCANCHASRTWQRMQ